MGFDDAKGYEVERSFGFLVVSIASLLSDELDALLTTHLEIGLSPWRVLAALNERRAATAADLCAELHYDSGAMTRLIGKLEERGWLARHDDKSDRRAYRLTLTRAGRTTCERGYAIARDNIDRALSALNDAQAEQLVSSLQTVKATLLGQQGDASTPFVKRR